MGNTVEVVRLSDFDDMAIPACKNSSKVVIGALAEKRFYSTTNSSIVGWNIHVAGVGSSVSLYIPTWYASRIQLNSALPTTYQVDR